MRVLRVLTGANGRMILRTLQTGLVLLAMGFALSGCSAYKMWEKQKKNDEEEAKGKSRLPSMTDPSEDPNFQAYIGRLRRAVSMKDYAVIASMMTPNFGYRWDAAPPGETPFHYWDRMNLWPELSAVINDQFVPFQVEGGERFMVAPPQFASAPDTYNGYRAGIKLVNGAWKFVYFVPPDPGAGSAAPQQR